MSILGFNAQSINSFLHFWKFWIFEKKNDLFFFSIFSTVFWLFCVFVKEIVIFNIGFGFVVFKSIW